MLMMNNWRRQSYAETYWNWKCYITLY